MAKSTRRRQRRRNRTINPVLRPVAWAALLSAAAAVAFASPVYADPTRVPDRGAPPVPSGALRLPGAPAVPGTGAVPAPPPLVNGPLANKIYAKEVELAGINDQYLKLEQERSIALAERTLAEQEWAAKRQALAEARAAAESAAAEALKDAAALPPGAYGSDLHGLSELARAHRGETGPDTSVAGAAAAKALAAEQAAYSAYLTLDVRVRTLDLQLTTLASTRQLLSAELTKLKEDNAAQLAQIEREQEALDQKLGEKYIDRKAVAGKVANPKAMEAVRYALAQRGDPYEWGAEGPDRFDCSGLMWAAYKSAGFQLPRVANDQYYATRHKSVSRSALLPGDLIFFASGSHWTSIYHVGMYIGNGKMVVAPTWGEVVKIQTVGWSRFYVATRVFDAVPAPTTKPSPSPSPTESTPTEPTPSTPTPTAPSPTQSEPTEPTPSGPTPGDSTSPSASARVTESVTPVPSPAPTAGS